MHTHADPLKRRSVEIHGIVISGAAFDLNRFLKPLSLEMQVRNLVGAYSFRSTFDTFSDMHNTSVYFDTILSQMVDGVWSVAYGSPRYIYIHIVTFMNNMS